MATILKPTRMSTTPLSVIITTYNSARFIRTCLEHLLASTTPPEIIVVDNCSTDDTAAIVTHDFPTVTFLRNANNLGFGAANNRGAKLAAGQYFCFMNPDVYVAPTTLTRLARQLDEQPLVGMVGPQLIYPDGHIQDSFRRFMRPHHQIIKRLPWLLNIKPLRQAVKSYLMWNKNPAESFTCDWLVGACLMIKKEVFHQIGGFDERYFLFMEDTDLCRSVGAAGYQVLYYPQATAQHHHERLSDQGPLQSLRSKTFWIHVQSAFKYYTKWWRK